MKTPFTTIALSAALLVAGCSSTSHVLVAAPRAPRSPDQVKIYLHAPKNFEEIALLNSSSQNSWAVSDQGKMDTAMRRMKEEAAKLGANGVLLRETGDQQTATLTTGSAIATKHRSNTTAFATGVAVPITDKKATGVAIFVVEE